jgi:hypothetical protein
LISLALDEVDAAYARRRRVETKAIVEGPDCPDVDPRLTAVDVPPLTIPIAAKARATSR